jgi:hypothetical protein
MEEDETGVTPQEMLKGWHGEFVLVASLIGGLVTTVSSRLMAQARRGARQRSVKLRLRAEQHVVQKG